MGRKSNHLMESVYAHLSKNGCQKSGFLADPDLTGTVFYSNPDPHGDSFIWRGVTITGERLQNLGLCSGLKALEQGGVFILPYI
jgi:hypothetical protein